MEEERFFNTARERDRYYDSLSPEFKVPEKKLKIKTSRIAKVPEPPKKERESNLKGEVLKLNYKNNYSKLRSRGEYRTVTGKIGLAIHTKH